MKTGVASLSLGFDLLQQLWELVPVVHDLIGIALFLEDLCHLLHLLLAFFDAVDTDIADKGDSSSHGGGGSTLAVLDSDCLGGFDAELLTGVEVDLGVGLGRGRVERGGGGVDVLVGEVVVDLGLDERGNDTRLGRGGDNTHRITLLLETLELLGGTGAGGGFLRQLLGDTSELLGDIVLEFVGLEGEVVLLLQADQHATEVLTDKVFEEAVDGVAFWKTVLFKDFVGEIGTCFEGKTLREDEGVVAVEKDVLDLEKEERVNESGEVGG